MILYKDALDAIYRSAGRLAPIEIEAQQGCGYVLARAAHARGDLPPFANSAMDGFAVRAHDIAGARKGAPVLLPVIGCTHAGDSPATAAAGAGAGAWEIMTGAALPAGYDAVVRCEDVMRDGARAGFSAPVASGNNIRALGTDFCSGDEIAPAGTLLSPFHIMALAAAGNKSISVYPKPSITIVSTGSELVENADSDLRPGQIRSSNGPYLMSALRAMGYLPHYGGVYADAPDIFEKNLAARLPKADIIISTGAVSAGARDFIPTSLRNLGAQIVFHKVAIRPGKPILYAVFPNGTKYFGLPGNPISAVVGLRFFVIPLLRYLQGMAQEIPLSAPLSHPKASGKGLRFFCKAHISVGRDGKIGASILDGQESFKINSMLKANGWAVLAEDWAQADGSRSAPKEQMGALYPLVPGQWALAPA